MADDHIMPFRRPMLLPALAVLALLLALLTNFRTVDLDVFHEMALARQALRTGHFPYRDFASFTATADPVIDHEWLSGFVFYAVATATGAAGFMAFKHLLVAGIVALLVRASLRRGATAVTLCMLAPLPMVIGCIGLTTIRAQVFTLLLGAALLGFLTDGPSRHRLGPALWLPLQWLWLNLHGGFVAGIGILGCTLVEQALRQRRLPVPLLLVLGGALALIPLNPYGPAYAPFLWRSLALNRPLVTEWQPITTAPAPILGLFTLALLIPLYALVRAGWRKTEGILLLGVTALLAILHTRHASLLALVWIAYVPAWIEHTPLGGQLRAMWRRHPGLVQLAALGVIVAALALAIPRQPWRLEMPTQADPAHPKYPIYPAGAVAYLHAQHFRGNLMTPFEVGAFVSWRLLPEVKVGLDSRYEVAYDPAFVLSAYHMYQAEPGWQAELDQIHPDLILVARPSRLAQALAAMPQWKPIYQDDQYHIYARPESPLPVVDCRGQILTAPFP